MAVTPLVDEGLGLVVRWVVEAQLDADVEGSAHDELAEAGHLLETGS